MNDGGLAYEKPILQYWTFEDLNCIEAAMSGGGETGTGFGFTYGWDVSPRITTSSSIDIFTLGIEGAIVAIVSVATRDSALAIKVAGKTASKIAREIVESGVEVTYYKSAEYCLKAIPSNSAGVPTVCGSAVLTHYYGDSAMTAQISEPTKYAIVSSGLEYMIDECPIA